jgi:hypothetical protein
MRYSVLPDTIVVGVLSAVCGVLVGVLGSRASHKAAEKALYGTERQLTLTHAIKIAEFRQAWINDLRESMARFHSIGILENARTEPDFYRLGTKIELLMDRNDVRFQPLKDIMYGFYSATTEFERLACNGPFVEISQDILKTEWEKLKTDLNKAASRSMEIDRQIS